MTRGGKKAVLWVVLIVVGLPVLIFIFEQINTLLPANF